MKFANATKPRQEIRGDGAPGGWLPFLPKTVSCPVGRQRRLVNCKESRITIADPPRPTGNLGLGPPGFAVKTRC